MVMSQYLTRVSPSQGVAILPLPLTKPKNAVALSLPCLGLPAVVHLSFPRIVSGNPWGLVFAVSYILKLIAYNCRLAIHLKAPKYPFARLPNPSPASRLPRKRNPC